MLSLWRMQIEGSKAKMIALKYICTYMYVYIYILCICINICTCFMRYIFINLYVICI